jgi:hypothetical protein
MTAKIQVNGRIYKGSSVSVVNNKVFIDGVEQDQEVSPTEAISMVSTRTYAEPGLLKRLLAWLLS